MPFNLFGKKDKAKAAAAKPDIVDTIGKLRGQIETFDKREEHLNKQVRTCLVNAKAMSKRKNKRGALNELKKKKMYEKQLDGLMAKKMNIENQIFAMEEAQSNVAMVTAMSDGQKALSTEMKKAKIEDVDDLVDDMEEQLSMQNEINEALSAQIGMDDMDDEDLMAELDDMEDEVEEDLDVGAGELNLPDAGSGQINKPQPSAKVENKEQKNAEDAELEDLEALLN